MSVMSESFDNEFLNDMLMCFDCENFEQEILIFAFNKCIISVPEMEKFYTEFRKMTISEFYTEAVQIAVKHKDYMLFAELCEAAKDNIQFVYKVVSRQKIPRNFIRFMIVNNFRDINAISRYSDGTSDTLRIFTQVLHAADSFIDDMESE